MRRVRKTRAPTALDSREASILQYVYWGDWWERLLKKGVDGKQLGSETMMGMGDG